MAFSPIAKVKPPRFIHDWIDAAKAEAKHVAASAENAGAEAIGYAELAGFRYPVTAYPGALRFVFVYLLPIAWTTTIPASALTGRLGPEIALAAAAVAALAFVLARLFWRAALRRYTGASG